MKNTKRKTKKERISENETQEQNDVLFSCQIEKSKFKKLIKKQSDCRRMYRRRFKNIVFDNADTVKRCG